VLLKCFGIHLFFPTIPKPLRQYTLLKKDDPFRLTPKLFEFLISSMVLNLLEITNYFGDDPNLITPQAVVFSEG